MADWSSFTCKEENLSHYHWNHYHSESPWNDVYGFGRIKEEETTHTDDVRTSEPLITICEGRRGHLKEDGGRSLC